MPSPHLEWQIPSDAADPSALLRVTPAGGIEEVRLDKVKHSFVDVANPVNASSGDANDTPKRQVDVAARFRIGQVEAIRNSR